MHKTIKYIGLDVHKNTISIGIADENRDGEVRYYGQISNNMDDLSKVLRKLISKGFELECVYEAGGCGYYLYRYLTHNGINCTVIAPSKIPRKSGDRLKNDKRDCLNLARLHRAGDLTTVYVPNEEDESLRDLVRGRSDAQNAHKKAKQQLGAFYCGIRYFMQGKVNGQKRTSTGCRHFHCLTQGNKLPFRSILVPLTHAEIEWRDSPGKFKFWRNKAG